MDPIEPWVDRDELRRLADALLTAPAKPTPEPANDATYGDQFVGFAGEAPEPPAEQPPAKAPATPADPPAPARAEQAAKQAATDMAAAALAHETKKEPLQELDIHNKAQEALATARQIAQRGGMLDATPTPEPASPKQPESSAPVAAQLTQVTPAPEVAQPIPVKEPPPAPEQTTTKPSTSSATPFLERLRSYGTWLRESAQSKAFFLVDREGGVLIDEVQSPKLQQVARTLAQASRTANRQAGAPAIGNLHIKVSSDSILEVVPVTTRYGPLILGIIIDQPLGPENVETVANALQRVVDGDSGI